MNTAAAPMYIPVFFAFTSCSARPAACALCDDDDDDVDDDESARHCARRRGGAASNRGGARAAARAGRANLVSRMDIAMCYVNPAAGRAVRLALWPSPLSYSLVVPIFVCTRRRIYSCSTRTTAVCGIMCKR